jgi:type I restriction enzyme S subunit
MSSETLASTMKQGKTPALVPKLRFPEVREEEKWMLKAGNSLFAQIKERNPEPGLPVLAITQEHGAIPRHMIDYHVSVTEKSIESYKVVQVGDFIISLRSFQGGIEYSRFHGICSPAYVILRPRVKGSGGYFRHYLKTDGFIRILTKNLEGLRDGKMISYAQFSDLLLPIPGHAEQQKIAACLTSLDELIAAQAQKVEALKTHKKGLMQQLFPREGETVPRLRFPGFEGAREWSEEKLEDLVHLQDGFAFKSADFVSGEDGATRVIRITDINSRNTNEDKVYISTAFLERNNLWKYCVEDGDLLLSLTGAAGFNFFTWNGGLAAINQRTAKVTARKKTCHSLLQILAPLIHSKINERGEGQNNNLSKEFLKTIFVLVPEPDEQQLIADCLATLDSLINAETQKLGILKTHKKGLMQQLFPSVEEVATT